MKKIILVLSIFAISGSIAAQNKNANSTSPLHLSFGIDFGKPAGKETKAVSNFVIGGDLQLSYFLTDNFSASVSAGVDARIAKGGIVNTKDYAPLLAGLRYYLSQRFYFSEQAGYSIAITKGLKGAFTDVFGIGYKTSNNSDILLAYKGLFYSKDLPSSTTTGTAKNSFSTIDLRIAFNFGGNK